MTRHQIFLSDDELGCIIEALGFAFDIHEHERDAHKARFDYDLAKRLERELERTE